MGLLLIVIGFILFFAGVVCLVGLNWAIIVFNLVMVLLHADPSDLYYDGGANKGSKKAKNVKIKNLGLIMVVLSIFLLWYGYSIL